MAAVQSTYQAGNFSGAILDAMHYMSNILRERTGADGDGQALVGQALGGDSPRLRINKLQSETERNEQRGMESLLRGMYQAIRNPRSHEQMEDTQEAADAIIHFINYLLGIIEKSEEPFVTAKFMASVFDPDFYRSQQYAELLVQQIPTNKRFDILVALYRDKLLGDIHNVALVVRALVSKLPEDQVAQYLLVVSDELSTVTVEKEFRYCLQMVPVNLWEKLSDVPRLRAENRIIREIQKGAMFGDKCSSGGLATWARDHLHRFSLKDKVASAFIEKLQSTNQFSQWYVVSCFLQQLPLLILGPERIKACIMGISNAIRQGNDAVRAKVIESINWLPSNWQQGLVVALEDLTDVNNPAAYLADGTPFLAEILDESPESAEDGLPESAEDEIPF